MIIAQAPLRVSFLGGGTDFPQHFSKHGGAVLATSVDKFAYVTLQPFNHRFFDHGLRISYRRSEQPATADGIEHPAIRACLKALNVEKGIELHHMADLPAKTGLGSSSTFVVAMLNALYAYQGKFLFANDLARQAIEIERYTLNETGGFQDQIMAAFGGIQLIRFHGEREFTATGVPVGSDRVKEIQGHMLLMYTGIERESYSVLKGQVARTTNNYSALCRMSEMAMQGAGLLASENGLKEFGRLLDEGWRLKQTLSNVSLPEIDAAYEAGMKAGAWGGKLLGAGQGGFLMFFADPDCHDRIRAALPHMHSVEVNINAPGSRIVFAQG